MSVDTQGDRVASSDYAGQERGSLAAYQRYLDGMDASMKQKVALTAAHLLCRGRVADMGMGSGTGSHSFAALYPALRVTGVDVNPEMVRLATERHRLPNLDFIVGDIGQKVFEPGSLDAILDSSVLHHVTSFSGYEHAAAGRALENQVGALRDYGVLVVRDFVDPGPGDVLLDVPDGDGDGSDDPRSCSTAKLLERFAREFRSLAESPGFALRPVPDHATREGFRRYELAYKHAVEFLLRKDYRRDWESEVKEEYTYFTQQSFEAEFRRLGLRVLASVPLRNPWILRHRYEGRYALARTNGDALDHPPTNYVIVGERVPPGEGVRIVRSEVSSEPRFLELEHFENRNDGRVFDLVRRPHLTIDVLPWFEEHGDLFVLVRGSYPRPIVAAYPDGEGPIDESSPPHYLIEPLNVLQGDKPLGQTVEEALATDAGIAPERLKSFRTAGNYYPSPGGIQEEVRALHVEIEATVVERPMTARSGFRTSGQMRAIEARQLLRTAEVGALPDARLELNVYELLLARGERAGPWIGEKIALSDGGAEERVALGELFSRPHRRAFTRTAGPGAGFLRIERALFRELDASDREIAAQELEYVVPTRHSSNTVAVAMLRKCDARVLIGVDQDDLPAVQCFTGNSDCVVAPAWRLPKTIRTPTLARRFVLQRLVAEYGAVARELWELGGPYRPSPGVTPETVFPIAVEVASDARTPRRLDWVDLAELVGELARVQDGHLRIVALRAAHAVGLL